MRSSVSSRCRSSTPPTGVPVETQDDVAFPDPGGRGRAAWRDRRHSNAGAHRELVGAGQRARNRYLVADDADVAAADPAVANQARRDEPRRVARDREAESLRRRQDRRVDADHFAARGDERPAGIARIERRIGLNDVFDQAHRLRPQRSANRADDARRDGMMKAVRIADGHRDLPHAHVARIAESVPRAAARRQRE